MLAQRAEPKQCGGIPSDENRFFFHWLRIEAISEAALGTNRMGIGSIGFDFLAQPNDINIHRAAVTARSGSQTVSRSRSRLNTTPGRVTDRRCHVWLLLKSYQKTER